MTTQPTTTSFTQTGSSASATFHGNYNDVQGNQDHRSAKTIGSLNSTIVGNQNQTDSRTYHATTINIITIGAGSAAEPSVHRILQTVAGPSNTAASDGAHGPLQSCHQQAIDAADNASGLIVSIVHLLVNRTESLDTYRDLKRSLVLLNHTILMTRLALQTFEYTPLGLNLARTIKPAILDCRIDLQELFDRLEHCREGLNATGIRHLWSRVLWSGLPEKELSFLKDKLGLHQVMLREFLATLNSVSWTDLGNVLHSGTVSLREFQANLRRGPLQLQHVVLKQIIVVDHLGSNIPIPTMFCSTWRDFHYVLNGYCEGRMGVKLVRKGDFQLINSIDNEAIRPAELVNAAQPGMVFEMSIVLRLDQELVQRKCPRCRYVNGEIGSNGWIECRKCSGHFKVDESVDQETTATSAADSRKRDDHVISPASSRSEVDHDETQFFRRIQVFFRRSQLSTPHKDVKALKQLLTDTYGYEEKDIAIMRDEAEAANTFVEMPPTIDPAFDSFVQPTRLDDESENSMPHLQSVSDSSDDRDDSGGDGDHTSSNGADGYEDDNTLPREPSTNETRGLRGPSIKPRSRKALLVGISYPKQQKRPMAD